MLCCVDGPEPQPNNPSPLLLSVFVSYLSSLMSKWIPAIALVLLCAAAILPTPVAAVADIPVPSSDEEPFAGYGPEIPLVKPSEFREGVMEPTLPIVMFFYKADCDSCHQTVESGVNASRTLKGLALFKSFDATDEKEALPIARMFGIQQFPAIVLFNPQMAAVQGQPEGSFMKHPIGYSGGVSGEDLTRWVLENSASQQLFMIEDEPDLWNFLHNPSYAKFDIPKVLLLTKQTVLSPIYRALSHQFRYGAQFAVTRGGPAPALALGEALGIPKEIDTPAPSSAAEYLKQKQEKEAQDAAAVASGKAPTRPVYPALAIWTSPSEAPEIFSISGMTREQIVKLLDRFAVPAGERRFKIVGEYLTTEHSERKKEAALATQLRQHPPKVISTVEDWQSECMDRKKGFCVACFVEEPGSPNTMNMLIETSKKMSQRVKDSEHQIVIVDGPANYKLAAFFNNANDNGYPVVVYINPSKKVFYNHIGAFNERAILSFWAERIPNSRGMKAKWSDAPKFMEEGAAASSEEESATNEEL